MYAKLAELNQKRETRDYNTNRRARIRAELKNRETLLKPKDIDRYVINPVVTDDENIKIFKEKKESLEEVVNNIE